MFTGRSRRVHIITRASFINTNRQGGGGEGTTHDDYSDTE